MRAIAFLAVLLAAALAAAGARADGDPASDILFADNVFLSYEAPLGTPVGRQLEVLTAEARKARFPVKVAVIANKTDLGAVPELFGQPQRYATFLGQELSGAGFKALVVVMPNGAGLYGPSLPVQAHEALATLGKPRDGRIETLGRFALTAVQRVAGEAGHRLVIPAPPRAAAPRASSRTMDRVIIGAAALALGVAVALSYWRRRARRRA